MTQSTPDGSIPAQPAVTTDVLVVGSGPAGASAALLLASYGTSTLLVTKYGRLSDTPRAHITNQRTMEVMRDMGLEERLMQEATPWEFMGNTTFCTSLAGEELGRIPSWGTDTVRHADYELQSPTSMLDAPQTITEPILVQAAQERGARVRFDTSYVSHVQDDDGVTTTLQDRLTGAQYTVRSKYLIGADGARSQVAADLDLPYEGPGAVGGALSIVFEADLSRFVAHRPSVLYWMLQPGAEREGVGLGVLRMIKPWNEWMLMWGYEVAGGPPDLSDEVVRELAVALVGSDDFEMRVKSRSPWTVNHHFATTIARGRVFCAGDAIHRHPPTNGLGSNTSIQDSYNLAWKLAHVVAGTADPSLLDSYDAERAPIARQVVERANQSIADTGRILSALDLEHTEAEALDRQLALWKAPGPEGEKIRTALREAIAYKAHEFDAHGVEHNQRYASSAVVGDGTPMPEYRRDPVLYAQPTTWPGAKLPHTWVTQGGHRTSTLDLVGRGRFSVVTGIGGEAWLAAARSLGEELGLSITTVSIGPGQPVEDPYGTWADLREIEDGGVLLVRPDGYVAARYPSTPPSEQQASDWLAGALRAVLGRQEG
ncbi:MULTISPECIES: FAD-dependent oxidoreductase [unclassified Modestobacter]|uniref:FAD-dependent oxidoreductase n=1 Tax=unclassified Modestobacter TaxID=2643866 RepID=UPI0022AADE4D|nr:MULTISPECIES: FAD-dependent monooxygenase [unclassified Modestobacter]MCZ2824624.1 FAD-dependent monooxygenase [Modestobacter sp. VKM Ac-2981]MCZ2854873.1 FAD-dependent monooxygenase [Modestobacter sp. VKM Ac-2982]